jgi:hypothetical protein
VIMARTKAHQKQALNSRVGATVNRQFLTAPCLPCFIKIARLEWGGWEQRDLHNVRQCLLSRNVSKESTQDHLPSLRSVGRSQACRQQRAFSARSQSPLWSASFLDRDSE